MMINKASSEFSRTLEAQIKGHICGFCSEYKFGVCLRICGAELSIVWGGSYGRNEHIIRCGKGHINPELVKVKSYWQIWNDGEPVPSYIRQNIQRQEERRERRKRNEQKPG